MWWVTTVRKEIRVSRRARCVLRRLDVVDGLGGGPAILVVMGCQAGEVSSEAVYLISNGEAYLN
jgi:hypothetical protein